MSSDQNRGVHERLMAEAIAEARKAEGRTSPNPLVGAIVARDGEILARGFHARAGEAHGEVDALAKLDGEAEGADLYVNLEPCCHHGRTPPCTQAILKAGIGRVFVGTLDPFPEVGGKGVEQLREAGVEVNVGIGASASRALNRPYFKRITTGLPWVTVKYAMTLDGKIASRIGDSAWISGEGSRRRVHELRDVHDAILVGTGTLRSDNPRLTARNEGGQDPVRVVLDARTSASLSANVFEPDSSEADTILVTSDLADESKTRELAARGVEVLTLPCDERGRFDLEVVLRELARRAISNVFVEGGAQILGTLLDERLVDEVYAFVAPKLIGGAGALTAVAGAGMETMSEAVELEELGIEVIDERDVLIHGLVPDAHRAWVESMPEGE
ncbi:MAG: bifunctional diaminohydroxyphosphoribosylaminopyrimidine deaminase/5-amino-6-(5-phosphoribosylamino)uracil reductase RibD [Myxococcota bacterium]